MTDIVNTNKSSVDNISFHIFFQMKFNHFDEWYKRFKFLQMHKKQKLQ